MGFVRLTNKTKNQHYLSQVEQRLNSIEQRDSKKSKHKIYSFSLKDRESYLLILNESNGKPIGRNLSLYDLFSFDVIDKKIRMNFEELFSQYESCVGECTESLLTKLLSNCSDVKSEIITIFVCKFLSFIRNPFSIKKVLNTFGSLKGYKPTDSDAAQLLAAVLYGRKPQQKYICSTLGILDQEYVDWLSVLFMMLVRPKGGENILETTAKCLFENPSVSIVVAVYNFDGDHGDKYCLLSDRGFNTLSDDHLIFEFNLNSHSFIRYAFTDIDKLTLNNVPERFLAAYKKVKKTIDVQFVKNDLNALGVYNRRTIYQCCEKVYCGSREIHGLQQD